MRLIDADKFAVYKGGRGNGKTLFADMFKTIIDQQPTVDAEPVRHGKWIDEGYYADYTDVSAWRCSECGWHMIGYDYELFRYCPSCGANMEGEKCTQ